MTKRWISDDDAAALLQGRTPSGHPELAPLAQSFALLRASASTPPQPSPHLAANMATTTKPLKAHMTRKRARRMITWFAGLGVAAKLLLASTVAAAAVVTTGAAGVLPPGAQETFNSVVSIATEEEPTEEPTVVPTEEPTDVPTDVPTDEPTGEPEEGTHPDNFGGMVSELAQNKPGSGYEFGKLISAAAHDKKTSDDAEETDEVESDDAGTSENSGEHTEGDAETHGGGHGGGKPEGTPGGGKPDKAKKR